MRLGRVALILSIPVLTGANCGHALDDGLYDFSATEIIRDDCNVMGVPGPVGSGNLTVVGDELQIDNFSFSKTPATMILLVGSYQEGIENFYVDGSAANVTAPVTIAGRQQECLLDLETVHIDGATQPSSHTQLGGTMRISYQVQNSSQCVCELWMRFQAVHR